MRGVFVLIPAVLALAACGGSSNTSEGSPAGGAVVKTIQISEKEYSLNPSSISLPKPGTYAFEVTNDGSTTHAFTIEKSGSEGDEVKSSHISPGSHQTVKFTFSSGAKYEMYCPVDGHKAMGMKGTISVGGSGGGGTTTSPAGATTTNGRPGY